MTAADQPTGLPGGYCGDCDACCSEPAPVTHAVERPPVNDPTGQGAADDDVCLRPHAGDPDPCGCGYPGVEADEPYYTELGTSPGQAAVPPDALIAAVAAAAEKAAMERLSVADSAAGRKDYHLAGDCEIQAGALTALARALREGMEDR